MLISGDQALLLNVPHPARYALQKLIIYGERETAFIAKSSKDLMQAASLLAVLKERRPREVQAAWGDLIQRSMVGHNASTKEFQH